MYRPGHVALANDRPLLARRLSRAFPYYLKNQRYCVKFAILMPAAINRNPSIQAMRIIGARFPILLPLHTLPQLHAARLLPSPH
jgi:hypothetical protein